MLNLENQVCSLELAKKLKSLNVKQESLFWWSDWYKEGSYSVGYQSLPQKIRKTEADGSFLDRITDRISAFTCAELGEMLPWTFIAKRTSKFPEAEMFLMMSKDDSMGQKSFSIWYEGMYDDGEEFKWESIIEQNEAEARGKMLIYLIENGLCPSPSKT